MADDSDLSRRQGRVRIWAIMLAVAALLAGNELVVQLSEFLR